MTCPECGEPMRDDQPWCDECQAAIDGPTECQSCGEQIKSGTMCFECYERLDAEDCDET